ncbi:MAG TPA: hypothetical protein VHA11_03435 [Bryobacteraceae bacterium]|nr:hypothetical protein [Bryobacteraceae bacterium]
MIARFLILGIVCGLAAPAQQPAGENAGAYNLLNSFEVGYRFRNVNGDLGKYRSDVNYGNGIRLLSGSFQMNSRDGNASLFDELSLRTQGLGNDPYEFSSLRVEKNRWYRYDLLWRRNDYYNPALPLAGGQHLIDTQRTMQDQDFTLLPGRPVQLFVGYSRNLQDGPALSTTRLFQPAAGEFPLFENIRRLDNEYRLGGEANFLGARLTFMHGWVNYSETTAQSAAGLLAPDGATIDQFTRTEPYRGSSPYWRVNLQKQARTWAAAARFSYTGSRRRFFLGETATGADRFGAAQNVQTLVEGSGVRPMSTGNVTLSFFPSSRLTITSQTSFYNTRMAGDNSYLQLNNATLAAELINFEFLGIRNIGTALDANYRVSKWLGVYSGYHFATRRILSQQRTTAAPYEQNNDLHSGLVGLRLQPVRPLSISLDAEVGRNSRPIFPTGERNYHLLGGRVQYKLRTLLLSASARTNYNINSVAVTAYSSRARNYSLDASWTPRPWFGMDAGYSKLHLNTLSGIAYFASGQFVTGDQSVYISNIHAANLTAHFGLGSRVELDLGYSRVQDTGDGRSTPLAGAEGGSSLPVFLAAQTFPLTFESPLARLSVKLHTRLRWNAGYQFYRYGERFEPRQPYNANTGYTSFTFTF